SASTRALMWFLRRWLEGIVPCGHDIILPATFPGARMDKIQSVAAWMADREIGFELLEQRSALDAKVLRAIIEGRYTPSPEQRQRVASALGVAKEQIAWGHANEVAHLYGHGPQFGRTP